jgi:hypothetical protein
MNEKFEIFSPASFWAPIPMGCVTQKKKLVNTLSKRLESPKKETI